MTIALRNYNHPEDYKHVSDFLIAHHQPGNLDGNWIESMWEYMHFHPALDSSNMGRFGVWEEANKISGVAHYEWHLGEAFFQFHPAHRHLRKKMLDYAENNLAAFQARMEGNICAYMSTTTMRNLSHW
jgi:hypothetical protein